MRATSFFTHGPGLLLLGLTVGCTADPLTIDEVEPIGTVTGSFTCTIDEPDEDRFDLGLAQFAGDLESTDFIADLRTQGCMARRLAAQRGDVVSVTLLQQTRFDRAQVLELNLPVAILEAPDDSSLVVDGVAVFAGNGGFGSMYSLDPGGEPNTFARTAGGGVLISQWGTDNEAVIAGSFTDLRMGAL
jgi:hypothetical protein